MVAYVIRCGPRNRTSTPVQTACTLGYAKLRAKDWIRKSNGYADIYDVDANPRTPVVTDVQIRAEMTAEGESG